MRRLSIPLLLLAVTGLPACMGKVVPLSAQKGSTVLIPLAGTFGFDGPLGYGGELYTDHQRGELVWSIATSTGPVELVTRATSAAAIHPAAPGPGAADQIISLVDIPNATEVPLGTYELDVVHRYTDPDTGQLVEDPIDYHGEIRILPNSIGVTRDDGTPETVLGESTPFEQWGCNLGGGNCSFKAIANLSGVTPRPTIVIELDDPAWAAEVSLSYPASVIDVADVIEGAENVVNHRAVVFHQDDPDLGELAVQAVGSTSSFKRLWVTFALDDGAAEILDPDDLSVSLVRAWDRDGNLITRSASVLGLR